MKNRKYVQGTINISALFVIVWGLLSFTSPSLGFNKAYETKQVNQQIPILEDAMYVILGSFQIPGNAIIYSRSITVKGKNPLVGKYVKNGLYYVYAYKIKEDLEFARQKRNELRATSQFYDAWILYVGIKLEDLVKKEPVQQPLMVKQQPDPEPISEPKETKAPPPLPLKNGEKQYYYTFRAISATTTRQVPGYVTLIDAARNKTIKRVSTNETHPLSPPKSQSKEIMALCDIFGYVKGQVKFKVDNPMVSSDKNLFTRSGDTTTINFELSRHKNGDFLTMYYVYFYNDAAIMKPESKFELNALLDMLNENDKLEVRIHGHTNGSASGKLIKLKEGDSNFFNVTPNNEVGTSSAKELSKERAAVIKKWLVSHGIDEKRMTLKGWGGKRMLFRKTDPQAGKNVRVEIEILKD